MQRVLWVCIGLVLAACGSNEGSRRSWPRDTQRARLTGEERVVAPPHACGTLDALNQDNYVIGKTGGRSPFAGTIVIRHDSCKRVTEVGRRRVLCRAVAFLAGFSRMLRPLMGESQ